MKRILLPTDFSEISLNAIKYALKLMQDEVCEFFLLHTYSPPMISTQTMVDNSSVMEIYKNTEALVQKELSSVKKELERDFPNKKHTFIDSVSFNLLLAEMSDLVEEKKIDFVVMGTQGVTGAKEFFLGTNTMFAIKRLKIPVLAVPKNYAYETPREILFPTDFLVERTNPYLRLLKEICGWHESRLHILNSYFGMPLSEKQATHKAFLDTYFKDHAHLFHIADGKDVLEAVEEFQLKSKINLLVMVHNKHNFLENLLFKPVVNKIVYKTEVPFLVIPSLEKN